MIKAELVTARRTQSDVCGELVLLIQVFAQAVRDARGCNERNRNMALAWLNEPLVRENADVLGIEWGVGLAQITTRDLPSRRRDTWFAG